MREKLEMLYSSWYKLFCNFQVLSWKNRVPWQLQFIFTLQVTPWKSPLTEDGGTGANFERTLLSLEGITGKLPRKAISNKEVMRVFCTRADLSAAESWTYTHSMSWRTSEEHRCSSAHTSEAGTVQHEPPFSLLRLEPPLPTTCESTPWEHPPALVSRWH